MRAAPKPVTNAGLTDGTLMEASWPFPDDPDAGGPDPACGSEADGPETGGSAAGVPASVGGAVTFGVFFIAFMTFGTPTAFIVKVGLPAPPAKSTSNPPGPVTPHPVTHPTRFHTPPHLPM